MKVIAPAMMLTCIDHNSLWNSKTDVFYVYPTNVMLRFSLTYYAFIYPKRNHSNYTIPSVFDVSQHFCHWVGLVNMLFRWQMKFFRDIHHYFSGLYGQPRGVVVIFVAKFPYFLISRLWWLMFLETKVKKLVSIFWSTLGTEVFLS